MATDQMQRLHALCRERGIKLGVASTMTDRNSAPSDRVGKLQVRLDGQPIEHAWVDAGPEMEEQAGRVLAKLEATAA